MALSMSASDAQELMADFCTYFVEFCTANLETYKVLDAAARKAETKRIIEVSLDGNSYIDSSDPTRINQLRDVVIFLQ